MTAQLVKPKPPALIQAVNECHLFENRVAGLFMKNLRSSSVGALYERTNASGTTSCAVIERTYTRP